MTIQELFEEVAELKWPDGTFATKDTTTSVRRAFCLEIYVAFGRAVESGMLADKSVNETAMYCAILKLKGRGGATWTADEAARKVKEIAGELAAMG